MISRNSLILPNISLIVSDFFFPVPLFRSRSNVHALLLVTCLISLLIYRCSFTIFPCNLLVEETGHLSCRIFYSLDFADCIPVVSLNMFLCPFCFLYWWLDLETCSDRSLIFGKNVWYMLICTSCCILLGNMKCLFVFFDIKIVDGIRCCPSIIKLLPSAFHLMVFVAIDGHYLNVLFH